MLPKWDLNVDNLAILAKQFLQFFFCHLIGQVGEIKTFVIDKTVIIVFCIQCSFSFCTYSLCCIFCLVLFVIAIFVLSNRIRRVHECFKLVVPRLLCLSSTIAVAHVAAHKLKEFSEL